MIKFRKLFFKEVKELFSKQFLMSMAMILVIFYFIGQTAKTEMKKAEGMRKISVMNLDQSALSQNLASVLRDAKFDIEWIKEESVEAAVEATRRGDTNLLLVIPSGFGDSVERLAPKEVATYTFLRSFSLGGMRSSEILKAVIGATNAYMSDTVLKKKVPDISPEIIKNPIKSKDYVLVKDKRAEGSASAIAGYVYSQSVLVPIILFLILLFSAQMVITAIAMEKQNKTLETLLTVPISRTSIVIAKMLAAAAVGLIAAVIYMIGMKALVGGMAGDGAASGTAGMGAVIKELGLTMSGNAYLLLGISLFLALLCGLALATILGVLAEDFRGAQTLLLPITLLILVPYLFSFFGDINSMSAPVKIFILAIPFSHPFLATQNIMLGRYSAVLYGILYMAVVFLLLVAIAARIFSTDRVLTMKLRWRKKPVVL